MRSLLLTLTTCLFILPAQAKYSGGTGEPNDPYQIAMAADLIALGETPADYDKHFILTANIDLDPNLPGRKVFDKTVIAPTSPISAYPYVQGTPFTGIFDGNGHGISHLTIRGGSWLGLFGRLNRGAEVRDLGVVDVNIGDPASTSGGLVAFNAESATIACCSFSGSVESARSGSSRRGGLVGENSGRISFSYSAGSVSAAAWSGGLVGHNAGVVYSCYSTSSVAREDSARVSDASTGGLVGENWQGGTVSKCYSIGPVGSSSPWGSVGGLVGHNYQGTVTDSFWDSQTSGQATSAGGTGKSTAEMQTAKTFLDVGWDFVGETANGTDDIWWILEGKDYPWLWWERGDAASP